MKKDLYSRADIEYFILLFYQKVRADDLLGDIFNVKFPLNWETHIPLIVDFWETILLDTTSYRTNAMEKHLVMHKQHPFEHSFFERWLQLFNSTVDENFHGEKAELAKKRAASIAMLMEYKMDIKTAQ